MVGKVIVAGGIEVDGGGIAITLDGRIIRIPPWNPELRRWLRGLNEIVQAEAHLRTIERFADRLGPHVMQRVEQAVGELAESDHFVYQEAEGDGFICGSTGRPVPIPLPRKGEELA